MGIYNIDSIEKTDYTIKILAFDNMIKFESAYFSSLGDKPTLQQVVNELANKTGVKFTGSLPAYTVKKLEGFTCREVLGYVASICGGNAAITRDGNFTIVIPTDSNYTISTSNYFDYKREEAKYKIGKISCQVEEKVLNKGSLGADSMELEFENPWVDATILTDIYNKLDGFEYLGYSMKWQGDPSLDVGDIVTITDKKGIVRKHPILSQKFTYTGGLTSEISAKSENKNKNFYNSNGPSTKKVERVVMELALINKALIDVAYIGDLTAGNIKFDTASGTILDLQTLLSKFVTGENGQFLNLTTDNVVIANAVIKDAMIENISVNKLKAGSIDTNKITLASSDGGLSIVGPTMQFKDKDNKIRIQIGRDKSNNFTFSLFDETGTGVLIDHTGIREGAIANDLIVSDMIAGDSIGEKQINYSSFVSGFNKDTNTNTIKSSKVNIDLLNQTLDIAFNSLKTQADGTKSLTESHSTIISTMQGEIKTAINNTQIVKDGQTILLKDDYNRTVATVNSINSTIGSHTTQINEHTGKITGVETRVNSVERDLNSITQRVSSTETKVTTITTTANSALANANTANSKIDNLQVGGRNLLKNSNKFGLSLYKGATLTSSEEVTVEEWDNKKATKLVISGGTDGVKATKSSGDGRRWTEGITYTASTWARNDGEVNITISGNGIGTYTLKPGESRRVVISGVGNGTSYMQFNFSIPTTADTMKITLAEAQIERGTKVSDWREAPEDIQTQIDANTTEITTTKNKVSTIETNLSSITSRVSSVEQTQTSINGKVTALETWKKQAEVKITDASIISTVSSQFYKKSETDGKYATQSSVSTLTQTVNKFEFKFGESRSSQLIYNGDFEALDKNWTEYDNNTKPGMIVYRNDNSLGSRTGNGVIIYGGYNSTRYIAQIVKVNEKAANFIVSCQLHTTSSGKDYTDFIRGLYCQVYYSDGTKSYPRAFNTSFDKYEDVSIIINKPTDKTITHIEVYIYAKNTEKEVRASQIQITEGTERLKWQPNPNEVINITTSIDAEGVTIKHQSGSRTIINDKELYQSNEIGRRTLALRMGSLRLYKWEHEMNYLGGITASREGSANAYGVSLFATTNAQYINIGTAEYVNDETPPVVDTKVKISKYITDFYTPLDLHSQRINNLNQMRFDDGGYSKIYRSNDGSASMLNIGGRHVTNLGIAGNTVDGIDTKIRIFNDGNTYFYSNIKMGGRQIVDGVLVNTKSVQSAALAKYTKDNKISTNIYGTWTTTENQMRHSGSIFTSNGYAMVEIPQWIAENIQDDYKILIGKYGFCDYCIGEKTQYYFEIYSEKDIKFDYEIIGKQIYEISDSLIYNSEQYRYSGTSKEITANKEVELSSKFGLMDDNEIEKAIEIENMKRKIAS